MMHISGLDDVTPSGDYPIPSRQFQFTGNIALRVAAFFPRHLCARLIAHRLGSYQVFDETASGPSQGRTSNKWEAMRMPADLRGKSILDIGCSEGFFANECAKRGAAPVVGIDTSLGRLLTAICRARVAGVQVTYRMGVFPGPQARGLFDYVLCLSVLHHSLRHKDLWRVLTDPAFSDDLDVLRGRLRGLRSLTAAHGKCIVEMPYEYDDPMAERAVVDFDRFTHELKSAGFADARCLGSWDYNPDHARFKDRMIYVAEA